MCAACGAHSGAIIIGFVAEHLASHSWTPRGSSLLHAIRIGCEHRWPRAGLRGLHHTSIRTRPTGFPFDPCDPHGSAWSSLDSVSALRTHAAEGITVRPCFDHASSDVPNRGLVASTGFTLHGVTESSHGLPVNVRGSPFKAFVAQHVAHSAVPPWASSPRTSPHTSGTASRHRLASGAPMWQELVPPSLDDTARGALRNRSATGISFNFGPCLAVLCRRLDWCQL